jgi:hypothetical protein
MVVAACRIEGGDEGRISERVIQSKAIRLRRPAPFAGVGTVRASPEIDEAVRFGEPIE